MAAGLCPLVSGPVDRKKDLTRLIFSSCRSGCLTGEAGGWPRLKLVLRRTPEGAEGREAAPSGAPPAGPEALLVQWVFDSGCPENHLGWGAVVINTDAQAPSPEMLGRAWASVLWKTRHFRV